MDVPDVVLTGVDGEQAGVGVVELNKYIIIKLYLRELINLRLNRCELLRDPPKQSNSKKLFSTL